MSRQETPGRVARWALFLLPVVGLAVGCGKGEDPWANKPGKRVMATFAPLYCFAANIAGDDAVVKCLLTDKGPHEYDPSPQDAKQLHGVDLFLVNGLGLDEDFAEKLKKNAANENLVIVEVGESIPANQLRKPLESSEAGTNGKEGAHAHHHGQYDPHVWLGLPQAILMVDRIRDEFKKIDPAHATGYEQRAEAYKAKLNRLLADGKEQLAKKKDRRLVTFHDSLQYFGAALDLEIVASLQSSPNEEPDNQRLQKLVDLCLNPQAPIRVIAVEPGQQSNSAAVRLLQELQSKGLKDAVIIEIDVLEEALEKDLTPEYYEQRMRGNIDRLVKALQ